MATQVKPSTMPTLRRGSTGDDVVYVQRLLNDINKANLTVDGIFGDRTEAAVKYFQETNKLAVDGIVGPNTWKVLLSYTD